MKIKTTYICPPIPTRNFDWSAVYDNFDASFEGSDENGDHWKSSPQGFGATEQEAIDDLLSQVSA